VQSQNALRNIPGELAGARLVQNPNRKGNKAKEFFIGSIDVPASRHHPSDERKEKSNGPIGNEGKEDGSKGKKKRRKTKR